MDVTLTDGGIDTRIIYEFKRPIGEFEAYQLLADEPGRDISGWLSEDRLTLHPGSGQGGGRSMEWAA